METVVVAAERFGFHKPSVDVLTDGLIHKTYKVTTGTKSAILQQVNTNVFKNVDTVVNNYTLLYRHLKSSGKSMIPAMLQTLAGNHVWIDSENFCWRAFEFIANTYTESLPAEAEKIFSAAKCYGEFTKALSGLEINQLTPTILGFHDVDHRYYQLQGAIKQANSARLTSSKELLEKIEQRRYLTDFYNHLKTNPEFRLRAMHHDTKLSNILFDMSTQQAVCPIDLDTVMPGYFFSDVGDMIRSMISSKTEDAPANEIAIKGEVYRAIVSGYEAGIGNSFTEIEKKFIHHSGMIMLYMQGIRFLTDYLSNDAYYKINYPEQNFDRALNQLTLLEKLEVFLKKEYQYAFK